MCLVPEPVKGCRASLCFTCQFTAALPASKGRAPLVHAEAGAAMDEEPVEMTLEMQIAMLKEQVAELADNKCACAVPRA